MQYQKNYFLVLTECLPMSHMKCEFIKYLQLGDSYHQCTLAKVTPHINDNDWPEDIDRNNLILINRHEGEYLTGIKEFPGHVYVCRPNSDFMEYHDKIERKDFSIAYWGLLFESEQEAIKFNESQI